MFVFCVFLRLCTTLKKANAFFVTSSDGLFWHKDKSRLNVLVLPMAYRRSNVEHVIVQQIKKEVSIASEKIVLTMTDF
jgi:hypothetical protein